MFKGPSLESSDETLVNGPDTDENTEQQTAQQEEGNSAKAVNQGTVTAITGTEYSLEKLADFDFLKNTFYSVDSTTSVDSERINAKNMLERDMTIQKDTSVPQILIYHTHSQEAFVDSIEGDASTTIVGVGEYLAEILAGTYGYNVIHNSSTHDTVSYTHLTQPPKREEESPGGPGTHKKKKKRKGRRK
ncbi:hypothetical protein CG709_11950, partial [Lachnotalea glycerini]